MRLLRAAVCWCAIGLAIPAFAHDSPMTTATLTHRAGHLRAEVAIDLLAWLQRLDGGETPVPLLALVDPDRLDALAGRARQELSGVLVHVGERAHGAAAIGFPTDLEVRDRARQWVMAQSVKADSHDHRPVRLVLDYRLSGSLDDLSIALPPSMGAAQITLLQPQTRVVDAGGPARFQLEVPHGP